MIVETFLRIWIGMLNAILSIIGLLLVEDTKKTIDSAFTQSLLFCYPGEIQIGKMLGLTFFLTGAIGLVISFYSEIFFLKLWCVIYCAYTAGIFKLFERNKEYWRRDSAIFFVTTGLISVCMIFF